MIAFETAIGNAESALYIVMAGLVLLWLPLRMHLYRQKSAPASQTTRFNMKLSSARTDTAGGSSKNMTMAGTSSRRLHPFFYLSLVAISLSLMTGIVAETLWSLLINGGQYVVADRRLTLSNANKSQPDPTTGMAILLCNTTSVGLFVAAVFFTIGWILKHPIWLYHSATPGTVNKALYQIDNRRQRVGKRWLSNGIALWAGSIWVLFLLVPTMMGMRLLPSISGDMKQSIVYNRQALVRLVYASQLFIAVVSLLFIRRALAARWRSCWRLSKWIVLLCASMTLDCVASIALAAGWDLKLASSASASMDSQPLLSAILLASQSICMLISAGLVVELVFSCVPPNSSGRRMVESGQWTANSSRTQSLLFTPPPPESLVIVPNQYQSSNQQHLFGALQAASLGLLTANRSSQLSTRSSRRLTTDMRKSTLLKQTILANPQLVSQRKSVTFPSEVSPIDISPDAARNSSKGIAVERPPIIAHRSMPVFGNNDGEEDVDNENDDYSVNNDACSEFEAYYDDDDDDGEGY